MPQLEGQTQHSETKTKNRRQGAFFYSVSTEAGLVYQDVISKEQNTAMPMMIL